MQFRLFTLLLLLVSASLHAHQYDSVVLQTRTGRIYGTLTIPQRSPSKKTPVVIIIPGSGPTDRNGNNSIMTNNSLRMLSDSLAQHGIASLRFDKRGIGASKKAADESKLLFTHYVDDVAAWAKKLRKDRRFNRIIIAGHSEGSLIGMMASKKSRVAGFISIAGAGQAADDLILQQLGAAPQVKQSTLDSTKMFFTQLKKSGHIDQVPQGFFQTMFRESVQGYLLSWIKYDPARELSGLKIPTLIIQGTSDMQVDTLQAQRLAAARPDAQLLIIPDMNHVFKHVPQDDKSLNLATYYDPLLPIKTELVQGVVRFVSSL